MTYNIVKKLIEIKQFDEAGRNDLISKLDVFLLNDRITQEQYEELVAMLGVE